MSRREIVFIAGHSRGGSTLLSLLLDQIPGFFAAGEIQRFFTGGMLDNELCTCGKPVQQCEFWNEVVHQAYGSWTAVNAREMQEISLEVSRDLNVLKRGLGIKLERTYEQNLNLLVDTLKPLYQALGVVSGAEVIVDSSKIPGYLTPLLLNPDLNVRIVNLTRHSCAVVFSKLRKKRRREVYWEESYMNLLKPRRTAVKWVERAICCDFMMQQSPNSAFARYEDIASKPQQSLHQLLGDLNLMSYREIVAKQNGKIDMQNSHMFGGNSMRFVDKKLTIRLDDEWRDKLAWHHKLVVKSLTLPWLMKYGYWRKQYSLDRDGISKV